MQTIKLASDKFCQNLTIYSQMLTRCLTQVPRGEEGRKESVFTNLKSKIGKDIFPL